MNLKSLSPKELQSRFCDFWTSCILVDETIDGYTQFGFCSKDQGVKYIRLLDVDSCLKNSNVSLKGKYDLWGDLDVTRLLETYNEIKEANIIQSKYVKDFFYSFRIYIQFVAAHELFSDKDVLKNTNYDQYREYLVKCIVSENGKGAFFKSGAQTNYSNKAKPDCLFDYDSSLPDSAKIDIYQHSDSDYLLRLLNKLLSNDTFLERDENNSQHYRSRGLMLYTMAMAQRDFVTGENNKGTEKDNSAMPFEMPYIIDTISQTGLIFDTKFVERYLCSLLTKPFVILSGLTGSGKTQLAMAFPKMICEDKSQYKLIPVGADWTNREQLLGYPNAIRKGEYVMPDNGALQLILEASKPENAQKPYFLVLDEMNMSYVERYFADFLSAMESGEEIPLWEGNDQVPANITLPKNLFIIGTINVDETTYMFSPKVLDRANVIEFRINKAQMLDFLNGTGAIKKIEKCSERAADFVAIAAKEHVGLLSEEMKVTLINMFETLSKIQKEFGYRTAHEMSRYITITKSYTDLSDEEAIDSAMVQKLLPKIHGSRKKVSPVLKALWKICYEEEASEIDTMEELPTVQTFKYPLTAEKIWRMFQIAQDNGFTSFAEA